MYMVVNTSGRHLSLQDIRITLSPRERIDLDSVCERRDIENSVHLKHSIKKGFIKVVVKDRDSFDYKEKHNSNGVTNEDLNKAKVDIIGMIKEALSSMSIGHSSPAVENTETVSESTNMSDLVLGEIHKKSIERLMSNTEKVVDIKSSKVTSEDIRKNLDELERLL